MVKLFVGNLGDSGAVTSGDLKQLFGQYGSVSECECVKNYAFVHMGESKAAQKALHELNGVEVKGRTIRVEMSEKKAPRRPSVKLFVGNLSEGTTGDELRALFETYTSVLEADVVRNYGFVHIDADAGKGKIEEIVRELNDYNLNGSQIRVQQSTSTVRQRPGMSGDQCFRCGLGGHWSKECPTYTDERAFRGRGFGFGGGRLIGRGLGEGFGGGPIRHSLTTYNNFRGRSIGGNNGNFDGNMFGSRIGQDPYPQPWMPSYIRERNNFAPTELKNNSAYRGYALHDEIESKMGMPNRLGEPSTDLYGRCFPNMTNSMMIPSSYGSSNMSSSGSQPLNSQPSSDGFSMTNERCMDTYGRFRSPQDSQSSQMSSTGLQYSTLSGSESNSYRQASYASSGSGIGYATSGLSGSGVSYAPSGPTEAFGSGLNYQMF